MGTDVLIDVLQQMVTITLVLILPPLGTALLVGLAVSLFQAITSIQEQTLAFVPKVIAVVLALIIAGHFMLRTLMDYTYELFAGLPAYGAM